MPYRSKYSKEERERRKAIAIKGAKENWISSYNIMTGRLVEEDSARYSKSNKQ